VQHLIVVRPESDQYVAQALAIPHLRAVAPTEAEAVETLCRSLAEWLRSAKLVRVEVPDPETGNPWLESFGRSATDSDFQDFVQELQQPRA